jgi:hypothetical protein
MHIYIGIITKRKYIEKVDFFLNYSSIVVGNDHTSNRELHVVMLYVNNI